MRVVKVIFEESKFNYVTSVSPQSDDWGLCSYFIGTNFNVEGFPSERTEICKEILIDGVLYRPLRNSHNYLRFDRVDGFENFSKLERIFFDENKYQKYSATELAYIQNYLTDITDYKVNEDFSHDNLKLVLNKSKVWEWSTKPQKEPKKLLRQVRDALNKNKEVEKLLKIAQILGVKTEGERLEEYNEI